jgi:hypothetical protein
VTTARQREARRGLAWRIIEQHYASRNFFIEIFRIYEARVHALVEDRGLPREKLKLNADETKELFDTGRLRALIDEKVLPLRDSAHAFFREHDIAEPYDSTISRIYHEVSILKEEHMSVRDWPRTGDSREFGRLFREVSEYYPQRLRRVRDLFQRAQRRLEELLPTLRDDIILLRSVFLFRDELWPASTRQGLVRFLGKMFEQEGASFGFLTIARSFFKGGFFSEAIESARMGVAVAGTKAQARSTRAKQLRETIRELDRLGSRAEAEKKALEEQTA